MLTSRSGLNRLASRLRKWVAPARPAGIRNRRPAVRVEELEARWVPAILTPAQVRHAYAVDQANYLVNGRPVTGDGSGQTIAIVDAYNDPYVWRDLQTFDRQFGLPDPSFRQYYYGSAS